MQINCLLKSKQSTIECTNIKLFEWHLCVCIRVFNYKLSHAERNRICISIRSNEMRKILSKTRFNARKLIILSRIRFVLFTCYILSE